jgi:predicted DNA-binding transcriptional regulator AlpA
LRVAHEKRKKNTVSVFLSIEDLATRLGVRVPAIYGQRYRGEGPPAMKVGRCLRFRLSDVEAWEDERIEAAP